MTCAAHETLRLMFWVVWIPVFLTPGLPSTLPRPSPSLNPWCPLQHPIDVPCGTQLMSLAALNWCPLRHPIDVPSGTQWAVWIRMCHMRGFVWHSARAERPPVHCSCCRAECGAAPRSPLLGGTRSDAGVDALPLRAARTLRRWWTQSCWSPGSCRVRRTSSASASPGLARRVRWSAWAPSSPNWVKRRCAVWRAHVYARAGQMTMPQAHSSLILDAGTHEDALSPDTGPRPCAEAAHVKHSRLSFLLSRLVLRRAAQARRYAWLCLSQPYFNLSLCLSSPKDQQALCFPPSFSGCSWQWWWRSSCAWRGPGTDMPSIMFFQDTWHVNAVKSPRSLMRDWLPACTQVHKLTSAKFCKHA